MYFMLCLMKVILGLGNACRMEGMEQWAKIIFLGILKREGLAKVCRSFYRFVENHT